MGPTLLLVSYCPGLAHAQAHRRLGNVVFYIVAKGPAKNWGYITVDKG